MRLLFILISFLFWGKIEAQNLDSVRHLLERNELGRALDLILEDTTATTEAWLLKAKIYQSISVDAKYKDLVADPKKEAFDALKNVYTLVDFSSETDSIANKIYEGYTNDGVAFFNAGTEKQDKTDYARALKSFKKAAEVRDFIYQDGERNPTDSTNLLYSAKAAIYGGDEPEAFYYSKKIADIGIARADFEAVYQWLLYYYRQNKDEEALLAYSEKFEKFFPKSSFHLLNYIDFINEQENYDYVNIFSFYNQLFSKSKNDIPTYRYAYIKDLFNYLYKETSFDGNNKGEWRDLLETALTDYTRKNRTDVSAKLLFGKFYINKAVDLQKEKPGANISSLLIKSNAYLKDVTDRSPKADKNLKIEAVKLLIGNYGVLRQAGQVMRYTVKLKQLTK